MKKKGYKKSSLPKQKGKARDKHIAALHMFNRQPPEGSPAEEAGETPAQEAAEGGA